MNKNNNNDNNSSSKNNNINNNNNISAKPNFDQTLKVDFWDKQQR